MPKVFDVLKIKPNTLPFKCPNCKGYGKVGYKQKLCHSCAGTGIVHVPQIIEKEDFYG
mgnify:CR=1 FL=1